MSDPESKSPQREPDLELLERIRNSTPESLRAIIENPSLGEAEACLILERRDISPEWIGEIASRKHLLKHYKVKKTLALHPHTPRLVSLRLLRDLYLMDLVQLTLTPGVLPELKRNAEDQLIARLPQLPLGQKITLARRGPARVAGALLGEAQPQVLKIVLDNVYLTEAHVLKALAREKIPARVVEAISHHSKWSHKYNVRLALVRQTSTTLSTVLSYLPEITVSDLRELTSPGIVSENFRRYLQAEIQRRLRAGEKLKTEQDGKGKPTEGGG